MHYACIAPTAYLEQYAGRGHFQLCLAQVALRDPNYLAWYVERRQLGDFVILDNGAYEEELVTFDKLCEVTRLLKPQVLTIPDKIDDYDASVRLMKDFTSEVFRHIPHETQLMRVFQHVTRSPMLWQEMVGDEMAEHHWDWIAFPRVLGSDRPEFIDACLDVIDPSTHIHAFGWTGNLNEVRQLAKLGVTSIDTSAPVWRGLHNYQIYDTIDAAWETQSGSKFDANEDSGQSYLDLPIDIQYTIDINLEAMQRACVAF